MKFLHLEDNQDDAVLVREILSAEWPGCGIKVVTNRAEFESELRIGKPDVVLSDFTLGQFNGLDALRIAREVSPGTPFIFLSGTIGEERAIAAVKAGARDYVLKDRMRRLVTAIRQALHDKNDIQQREAAEAAHKRFVAILEHTPDFVGLAALDGSVFYINRAGLRMLGLPESQDPGLLNIRGFHAGEFLEALPGRLAAAVTDGTWTGESMLMAAGGKQVPVSQVLIAHRNAEGQADYFSTVMRDITDAKLAERRIREQADLLNKTRDAIIVRDNEGRVTFWNEGAERIFGWKSAEALGRCQAELFGMTPPVKGEKKAGPFGDDDWHGEIHGRTRHGVALIMDLRVTAIRDAWGTTTAQLSIGTDITSKKSLEDQFLRAQRLESIGMLAAGIAHDLNNVLAPILMGAPILRDRVTDPSDIKMLTSLERSAERGAALVRQILGFAQGVSGLPQTMQVKHILREVGNVVRETFPRSISLDESLPADLWPIHANATQVHQVVLNLAVNARDAMPQGGTLRIAAQNETLDARTALAIEGGRPGNFMVIKIEDTGTGIPPEIAARIWEPFFTTKELGKGTGLGLSTVRGIVENHQGFIIVRTAAGLGTTFSIYFPASDGAADEKLGGTTTPFAVRGNGELILVVDDEASVREVTAAILSHHGYRVLLASDGTEAVALFAPRQAEISVVITDLNMPQLGGAAVINVVRRINPATKILAVSGMAGDGKDPTPIPPSADDFLPKPFKIDALLNAVHRLLTKPAHTGER